MCTQYLDGVIFRDAPQNDLHDQCHAIAVSALNSGELGQATTSALGALQQVSGNQVIAQGSLASRVSAGQFANISGRINALRFGSHAAISQGTLASNDDSSAPAGARSFYFDNSIYASQSPALTLGPPAGSFVNTAFADDSALRLINDTGAGGGSTSSTAGPQVSNPWGLFVQGSYNSGHHDTTAAEDPFDFHATSITAGLDYNFGPAVVGLSVGYDDYDAGFRTSGLNVSGGSARVEGTSASLYGAWFSDHWSFNGIASYGRLHTDLSRQVTYNVSYNSANPDPQTGIINDNCPGGVCTVAVNRTIQGNPSGSSFALGATAGYDYSVAQFDLQPSLTLNYRRATIDAFAERDDADPTDGLPLAFNDQTIDSLRTVLGLDVSRPLSAPFGVITPLAHVEWDHEFHTSGPNINAHYVYDPSLATGVCASCFALPTDGAPSNYGVGGLGVSVTLAHRIQAFVYDEVLFGYSDYHSNTVTIGLRGQL